MSAKFGSVDMILGNNIKSRSGDLSHTSILSFGLSTFMPLCLLVIFLLSMGGISLAADKIILKNGNVIEGRIVREKGDQIIIEMADAKATMGIPRSDILRIIMERPQSFLKAEEAFKKSKFREAILSLGNYNFN